MEQRRAGRPVLSAIRIAIRIAVVALAAAVLVATPAAREPRRFESVQPHMGTLVRIVVYANDEDAARRAFAAGFDRIRHLDAILSDYRSDSELSRLTETAVGRPIPVSADLFKVLHIAQEIAAESGGAFDITLGPVTRLWREARRTGRVPDASALEHATSRSGYRKLRLDSVRQTATIGEPGMALDAGGIGKGHAASEALDVVTRLGVRSAMIAVSGDIAVSAAPPGQTGWRVATSTGTGQDESTVPPLVVEHVAVSTSGASAQHLDAGNRRYSHIVNPANGVGLLDDLTVTVIARTGAEADALATAVSVLGVERGLRLLDARPDVSGLIVTKSATEVRVSRSARYPR